MKKMLDWLRSSPAIDPRSLRLPASAALDERPPRAQRMVVVDLETSGLNLQRDQLLAIGAVVIEDGAFIGSNSSLVAPITVAAGATIAAGSVITKDAPAGKLTVARARQMTVDGWQRPVKKPK